MSLEMKVQSALATLARARTLAQLEECSRAFWADWSAGLLSDGDAQALAEAIKARRHAVRGIDPVAHHAPGVAVAAKAQGRPSYFPPRRKRPTSPDRNASLERRRQLAASGVMPAVMAAQFTVGELATLRIVCDEARMRGACQLTLDAIAARAGVGITTARNALREAAARGLVTIEERRRSRQPNLPNIVRIVSRDWLAWIARGPQRTPAQAPLKREPLKQAALKRERAEGGGCKKAETTDTLYLRSKARGRSRPSRSPPQTRDECRGRSTSAH